MNHNDFFERLKEGHLGRGYLFTGEENFVKNAALSGLRQKLLPEGLEALNESVIEGGTYEDILAACETLPMMTEKRLVLVRDLPYLMSGNARGEKEEGAALGEYLDELPHSCCLVFFMRGSADKNKQLYKAITKSSAVNIVEFDPLTEAEMRKWLQQSCRKYKKTISQEIMDLLLLRAGRQLTRLDGEIGKICAHAGERTAITAEDLSVVTPTLECTVFELIDCLIARKSEDCFRMLDTMLESGEDYVRILAMITRQMRFMLHVSLAQSAKTPDDMLIRQLGISPYGLRRTKQQVRNMKPEKLRADYRECVDAEFAIKSGRMTDEEAVTRLMVRYLM